MTRILLNTILQILPWLSALSFGYITYRATDNTQQIIMHHKQHVLFVSCGTEKLTDAFLQEPPDTIINTCQPGSLNSITPTNGKEFSFYKKNIYALFNVPSNFDAEDIEFEALTGSKHQASDLYSARGLSLSSTLQTHVTDILRRIMKAESTILRYLGSSLHFKRSNDSVSGLVLTTVTDAFYPVYSDGTHMVTLGQPVAPTQTYNYHFILDSCKRGWTPLSLRQTFEIGNWSELTKWVRDATKNQNPMVNVWTPTSVDTKYDIKQNRLDVVQIKMDESSSQWAAQNFSKDNSILQNLLNLVHPMRSHAANHWLMDYYSTGVNGQAYYTPFPALCFKRIPTTELNQNTEASNASDLLELIPDVAEGEKHWIYKILGTGPKGLMMQLFQNANWETKLAYAVSVDNKISRRFIEAHKGAILNSIHMPQSMEAIAWDYELKQAKIDDARRVRERRIQQVNNAEDLSMVYAKKLRKMPPWAATWDFNRSPIIDPATGIKSSSWNEFFTNFPNAVLAKEYMEFTRN